MFRATSFGTIFALCMFAAAPVAWATHPGVSGGSSPAGRDVRVASHVGELSNDEVVWRSRYAVEPADRGRTSVLGFVGSLPKGAAVVETSPPEATLERSVSGRPVGLRLPDSAHRRHEVALVVRQPYRPESGLRPPVAGERAAQRISLKGMHYRPDASSGLREYPGYVAPRNYGDDVGDPIERHLGEAPENVEQLVYARPADVANARLTGEITAAEAHRTRVVLLLGGVLAVIGLLGGVGYKLLESRAEEERADAILEEHGASAEAPWGDEFDDL